MERPKTEMEDLVMERGIHYCESRFVEKFASLYVNKISLLVGCEHL